MLRAFTALISAVMSLLVAIRRAVSTIAQDFLGLAAIANPSLRNFSVEVVRPDDLLVLTFEFQNLTPIDEGGANTRLVRKDPGDALIIVHFPPQSIVEKVSHEPPQATDLPFDTRISGESRLVFRVPDSMTEIPFTLDALLDWSRYEPYLAPAAQPPPFRHRFGINPLRRAVASNPPRRSAGSFFLALSNFFSAIVGRGDPTPQIVRPDEFTALEIPYRLFLSPNEFNAWAHSPGAVAHAGRTELWHTRLGVAGSDDHPESAGRDNVDEYDSYYRTLRAIWSPDHHRPPLVANPFLMTLEPDHRRQLVALTADFNRPGCESRLIKADLLMLSSLGASMNVNYAFAHPEKAVISGLPRNLTPPPDLSLIEWRHRMSFGRDHYVRVVEKGYLFPFGHRAVFVQVSERQFVRPVDGLATIAYIRKREFVVVQQPEKNFGESGLLTLDGKSYDRMMPFKTVRIATLVTPDLAVGADQPAGPDGAIEAEFAFWIQTKNEAGGLDYLPFHLIATDETGQAVEFKAPLIFVSLQRAFAQEDVNRIAAAFNDQLNDSRRQYDLNGQKIVFAPPPDADPDGVLKQTTTFETHTISMGVELPIEAVLNAAGKSIDTLIADEQPRFFPTVVEADTAIAAAQKLLGKDQLSKFRFSDVFLQNGFESGNLGQVFAELVNPSSLELPADKSGGVVNPNFDITGLSRSLGPVGGNVIDGAANLKFNPLEFFPSANTRILGSISLADILLPDTGEDAFPKLISTQAGDGHHASLNWKTTQLRKVPGFVPEINKEGEGRLVALLSLHAESVTPLGGAIPATSPTLHVKGSLTNFQINLFEMIIVSFNGFTFVADTGKKLDVTADVDKVKFGGPLEFINVLAEAIASMGMGDGPSIDVSPTGIKVSYSFALPMIGAGAFSIQHIKLSAGLNLPFTMAPVRLRFAFSERHDPFMVSVYGITGGGFVGIAIGMDGVEQLEASFEVGGSLALNLVVAKGAVFIMLGLHFLWEKVDATHERVALAGYIRAGGSVEVLGLVSVSIEFYMELGFITSPPEIHGEASLTVEVEIACFSKSVSLSIEKTLPAP